MRAYVIEHAHILDGCREGVPGNPLVVSLAALVRHPLEIDRPRHVLVRGHVVLDGDGQIDDAGHVSVFLVLARGYEAARLQQRHDWLLQPVDACGVLVLLGERRFEWKDCPSKARSVKNAESFRRARKRQDKVPAVNKALAIVRHRQPRLIERRSLNEIANGLEITKSHCHNILKTLTQEGWLIYDDERRSYSLAHGLLSDISRLLARQLAVAAHPRRAGAALPGHSDYRAC